MNVRVHWRTALLSVPSLILWGAIALSVAINVKLLNRFSLEPRSRPASSSPIGPAAWFGSLLDDSQTQAEAELKALKRQWKTRAAGVPARDPRWTDPLAIIEQLRSEGAPVHVIRALATTALADTKVWSDLKESIGAWSGRSPETFWRIEDLHGALVRPLLTPVEQEFERIGQKRTYGDLPKEKIAAIEAIQQSQPHFSNFGPDGAAREAEIRSVLTPAEADDYFRYNSMAAKYVQASTDGIELTEAEYLQLLSSPLAIVGLPHPGRPPALTLTDLAEIRRILGDERFLSVMWLAGGAAAAADPVYRQAGLSVEERLKRFYFVFDRPSSGTSSSTSQDPRAAIAAEALVTYRVLTAGLDAAQIEAFDKTLIGRQLSKQQHLK